MVLSAISLAWLQLRWLSVTHCVVCPYSIPMRPVFFPSDYAGKVRVSEANHDGCVAAVALQVPQTFHRIDCQSYRQLPAARLSYFVEQVRENGDTVILHIKNLSCSISCRRGCTGRCCGCGHNGSVCTLTCLLQILPEHWLWVWLYWEGL